MYSIQSVKIPRKYPQAEYSQRHRHMKRVRALMLLGGKCVECGNNDMRVLHIDHVHNDGAAQRRQLGQWRMIEEVLKTPERFQALCANCHEIKHSKD